MLVAPIFVYVICAALISYFMPRNAAEAWKFAAPVFIAALLAMAVVET